MSLLLGAFDYFLLSQQTGIYLTRDAKTNLFPPKSLNIFNFAAAPQRH